MVSKMNKSNPKRDKKNSCFIAFIALLVAVTLLPLQSVVAQQPAQGQSIEEVGMEVHLDFYNNAPRAVWTIYAKKSVGGKTIIDETRHIPLYCTNYGVDIAFGSATFRSADRDYIKCLLPSFADEIKKISNGEIIVGERCGCKTPWIAANVDLKYDPSSVGPLPDSNPLFYHDDMKYALPYVDPPSLVSMRLNYAGAPQPVSAPFFLETKTPWNAVWSGGDGAEFLTKADFTGWAAYLAKHTLSTIKNSFHWANGQQINQATGSPGNFDMGTGPSVLFFGVDPATGSFLNGTLEQLDWDPGCRGGWG